MHPSRSFCKTRTKKRTRFRTIFKWSPCARKAFEGPTSSTQRSSDKDYEKQFTNDYRGLGARRRPPIQPIVPDSAMRESTAAVGSGTAEPPIAVPEPAPDVAPNRERQKL